MRLSAVFGPWERSNDVRDTPSPQAQILSVLEAGSEAVLARSRVRDWIYAVDVAEAVAVLIEAGRPQHRLYNISTGAEWSALQWGQELAALHVRPRWEETRRDLLDRLLLSSAVSPNKSI